MSQKIIYARGFPYGAPLAMLRGGGTKTAREFLKAEGFTWDGSLHAWKHYLNAPELREILAVLQAQGYDVRPKDGLDPNYVIDLPEGVTA